MYTFINFASLQILILRNISFALTVKGLQKEN